jgi:Domain of unknown function (DUF1844)
MSDQLEQHGLSFTAFVLSLASTAAIHFGDLPDPMSGGRSEPNLAGAAQMIEILVLLDQILYELRLRFVEASAAGKRIIEP